MKNENFFAMTNDEIFKKFQVDEDGLNSKEVEKRQEKYGLNTLPSKKKDSILKLFIDELKDPIILLLIIAIILSIFIGEIIDAIAIILIITIDMIIGVFEEVKASNTIDSLQKLVPEKVKVIRNKKEIEIDSSELTLGDFVLLESGDKISADIRIIENHNFTVDESILTGESISIVKNSKRLSNKKTDITSQSNIVFAGTSVVTGRAKGIVIRIGSNTEIGMIANTLNETKEEKSPLTIRVEKFSKDISIIIGLLSVFLIILLLLKDYPLNEILVSVIALSVSAMPEGLPLALTMALTIASNKMAKHNVITKKLNSVESLGSCTVIASDKTGTLTVNCQTAKIIVLPNKDEYLISGSGYSTNGKVVGKDLNKARELTKLGVINNEAVFTDNEQLGDSIDIAFKVLGKKLNIKTDDIEIIETIPYESENKYSACIYRQGNEYYCTVKGSQEVVAAFCNKSNLKKDFNKKDIEEQTNYLSKDGYRVIAIANGKIAKKDKYTEKDLSNLTFMGLVGFIDPIRKEVINSIKSCTAAGIKVLMITGDHPLTAYKIARDLKLVKDYSEVTTTKEVEEYLNKSEKEFDEFVKSKKVFSRVTSIEKLKIVESLKKQGEFVAVTGDGVNDSPALKTANIGVAMGSGTDIARETSKMIVLDDNFKSIVKGILEGRVAYANIRKITYFLLSCGLAEVLFFTLSILVDLPIPLLAIQLLWLNVITDGIQDIALSFERAEQDTMKQPPRNPKESLFDRKMYEQILISGLSIGIIVFGLWYYLIKIRNTDLLLARTYIMILMIIIQNIHAINCRSETNSIFRINPFSNKVFFIGIMGSIILGIAVIENPILSKLLKTTSISLIEVFNLFIIATLILLIMEIYKLIVKKYNKANSMI